ncbi:M15 family metallopeptidase [Defluviitalea phaphyphila]|uniref:M15 family metallopeptidase n=1 Tax=Defluviitalea phaphyphila TaxID=1473580 RepID=UPI00072FB6E2|nr:M15 family metallopeptidase [Defluviitalea phaphyphila]
MGKKLIFLFFLISVIFIGINLYEIKDGIFSKGLFNEIEEAVVISKSQGEGEEVVKEKVEDFIDKDEYINDIINELDSMKNDYLILVNKWNVLSENHIPSTLIDIAKDIPSAKSKIMLEEEAYKKLKDLFEAVQKDGITDLRAVSGYRPYSYQNNLYNAKVNYFLNQYDLEIAKQKASEVVAIPGTSEHQTGLAIDVSSVELLKTSDPLVEEFKYTKEGEWMYNNSWKYGFVLRYSPEKKDITGIISEPWHFRYVGIPHAEYITINNLSLEEYLKFIKEQKEMIFEDYCGNKYQIDYIQKENRDILISNSFNIENVISVSEIGEAEYIITQKIQ